VVTFRSSMLGFLGFQEDLIMVKKLCDQCDRDLVSLLKSGSVEAFEELMQRHETKAFNLALRLTRCQEDAEEVLQDAFTSIYRKIDAFEGKSAFTSWMYRIVVNAAFMRLRKRKKSLAKSMEDLTPAVRHQIIEENCGYQERSDSYTVNRELRTELEKAISNLPGDYRLVYILRDVDCMSNQEVAEVLNLSVPAIKSRLHRARLMLRKKLQHTWAEFNSKNSEIEYTAFAA